MEESGGDYRSSGHRHRMPVCFGPSPGPRQGPTSAPFDSRDARRTTTAVRFLTDAARLMRYLPPDCSLAGAPEVLVEHVILHNLNWLAGRGYSLLSVKFPVRYQSAAETTEGMFLSVLWENRPEPIMTGREELGFAKLYCELPSPDESAAGRICEAIWDGHVFARLSVTDLQDAPDPPKLGGNVLHHRYFPPVSSGGQSIDEMVVTPATTTAVTIRSRRSGRGKVQFLPATWEQMPTMFHIASALAALPVLEYRDASVTETTGTSDLREQRVLGIS